MVVGILRVEFRLPQAHSLKEKRGILKRALNQIRSEYNVSAAEVGKNDLWQSAEIGITLVGNQGSFVNSCLDQIAHYIENLGVGEITNQEMEIIHF